MVILMSLTQSRTVQSSGGARHAMNTKQALTTDRMFVEYEQDEHTGERLCGGRVTVSLEVLEPVPHILIAGGGHCGLAIAAACDNLGWSHSVFDVRNEYADDEVYPNAVEHHSSDVEDFISSLSDNGFMRFSDVLLLGHDWSVDQDLLIGLLLNRGDAIRPRIGAIGSRSKWKIFREAAISAGVSEIAIDSVRCPIGIQIGAESPEEIAIAVCAEIMAIEKGVQE